MPQSTKVIDVYLEIGKKRTFAGAVDWPGWSRSGRDESSALQALLDYAPRYGRVLEPAQMGFSVPAGGSDFNVVERLEGNATTDFGAPDIPLSTDAGPVDEAELRRFQSLLQVCWQAFDAATAAAMGKQLRKGPRGGGRDLDAIIRHVLESEMGYLSRLGGKFKPAEETDTAGQLRRIRPEILLTLESAARGELPARGPRGGVRWAPRYFVRRVAWHVLDHLWEIEDRVV